MVSCNDIQCKACPLRDAGWCHKLSLAHGGNISLDEIVEEARDKRIIKKPTTFSKYLRRLQEFENR